MLNTPSLYGFIILRHVNSEQTNKYWNHAVRCIRRFYPYRKIVIIDDNSNYSLVKADYDYKNIQIVQSEFQRRGELLPYYYYLKNKYFENAVIIHDSVFFHKRVNFEKIIGLNVLPFWFFPADKENISNSIRISSALKNSQYIQNKLMLNDEILMRSTLKWYGCFGVQSFINHSFLVSLEHKYGITNMINSVTSRADRCCLERIFGCMFFMECHNISNIKSLLGNIFSCKKSFGYNFQQYENDVAKGKVPKTVIKVWTGR
jgi:hypothetical protein